MSKPNRELFDLSRVSKDAADYRQHQRCEGCAHFIRSGLCEKVDGNIAPDSVCSFWTLMEENLNYDKHKEFYEKEYLNLTGGKDDASSNSD